MSSTKPPKDYLTPGWQELVIFSLFLVVQELLVWELGAFHWYSIPLGVAGIATGWFLARWLRYHDL